MNDYSKFFDLLERLDDVVVYLPWMQETLYRMSTQPNPPTPFCRDVDSGSVRGVALHYSVVDEAPYYPSSPRRQDDAHAVITYYLERLKGSFDAYHRSRSEPTSWDCDYDRGATRDAADPGSFVHSHLSSFYFLP